MEIRTITEASFSWGESVVWDERRQRLYFVDCLASALHWLEGGEGELHTRVPSSWPTGVVPMEDGRLLTVLDAGLVAVDPDDGREEVVTALPEGMGERANDACVDPVGRVITGTLNLGPAEGSTWRWSVDDGWLLLDPAIANTNGPAVVDLDGVSTLLVGDSSGDYYAYDYDVAAGSAGPRRVFGSMADLPGVPDGATTDVEGGYWCALAGGSQLVRFTSDGLDRTIPMPVEHPTDAAFGGPDLDRLYVTAIGAPLFVVEGVGATGRLEPRARV